MEKQHKTTIRQPIRQPDSFGNVCIWVNVGIKKMEKVNTIQTFEILDLQESPKYTNFQGNRVVLWVVLWLSYVAFPLVLGCLMVVLWDSLDQTHSFHLASWPGVIGGLFYISSARRGHDGQVLCPRALRGLPSHLDALTETRTGPRQADAKAKATTFDTFLCLRRAKAVCQT